MATAADSARGVGYEPRKKLTARIIADNMEAKASLETWIADYPETDLSHTLGYFKRVLGQDSDEETESDEERETSAKERDTSDEERDTSDEERETSDEEPPITGREPTTDDESTEDVRLPRRAVAALPSTLPPAPVAPMPISSAPIPPPIASVQIPSPVVRPRRKESGTVRTLDAPSMPFGCHWFTQSMFLLASNLRRCETEFPQKLIPEFPRKLTNSRSLTSGIVRTPYLPPRVQKFPRYRAPSSVKTRSEIRSRL